MTDPERHTKTVRERLKRHAQRGALRQFEERPAKGGKTEFRFVWLLNKPFTIVFDPKRSTLTLKNALPAVPPRSHLDRDVRAFIKGRTDASLPAHRRLDPKRAELSCVNRKSSMSFTLTVKRNQFAYGTTKLLNLTNELFGFLDMYHIQYLWEHFDVPEE